LGDFYARLNANRPSDILTYSTSLTATAPTGDTSAGISTGRATVNWDNRMEHDFGRMTPFAEGSIGNSLGNSLKYKRSYTTLGAASEFRGGMGLNLHKNVGVEASGYADVGYGNQKLYSRSVRKGTNGTGNPKHPRPFDTSYLSTGTASLVEDRGLSADLSLTPFPRMNLDLTYNHSIHFALDSVSATVGIKLGHLGKTSE
jgi:hypothetical protein